MDQDIQVNLPGIFNPDPEQEGARAPLTVSLTREGLLFIESMPHDLDSAVLALEKVHDDEPMRRLALRADAGVPYGRVRDVFGRLREIGFPGISLMVGYRSGRQPGVAASTAPVAEEPKADPQPGPDAGPAAAPADPAAGVAPVDVAPAPAASEG